MLRHAPARVGTPRRRAVRRILQELLPLDPKRPLLGSLGPSISYEDLDGSRPSVAVVAPDRAPVFASDAKGTWCQFGLGGRKHQLPVVDERILEARDGDPGARRSEATRSRERSAARPATSSSVSAPHAEDRLPSSCSGVLPRP